MKRFMFHLYSFNFFLGQIEIVFFFKMEISNLLHYEREKSKFNFYKNCFKFQAPQTKGDPVCTQWRLILHNDLSYLFIS